MSIVTASLNPSTDGNFVTRALSKFATRKLPRQFKRLIYISSIMGLIQQVKDPDMHLVNKLNSLLKIAKHSDAFVFPMYIKSTIWKDISVTTPVIQENDSESELTLQSVDKQDLTSQQYYAVGRFFAERSPSWLRYGSMETMINDVITLVRELKSYHDDSLAAA